MDVSVLLILEHAEQMTGSGCCGKLGGDASDICGPNVFHETQAARRQFGLLHRAVREFFPTDRVEITSVDPRNQLYLIPKLWRDVWHYRPGWKAGLQSMFEMFSLPAVLVNGRIVSRRGQLLDPDQLCHLVTEALASSSGLPETDEAPESAEFPDPRL